MPCKLLNKDSGSYANFLAWYNNLTHKCMIHNMSHKYFPSFQFFSVHSPAPAQKNTMGLPVHELLLQMMKKN